MYLQMRRTVILFAWRLTVFLFCKLSRSMGFGNGNSVTGEREMREVQAADGVEVVAGHAG